MRHPASRWRARLVRKGVKLAAVLLVGAGAFLYHYWWDDTAPSNSGTAIPGGTEYRGSVLSISDGDGVRFQTAGRVLRIRMDSIDAPEADSGPGRPGQPYGKASADHLRQWLAGRTVVARCFETDQYGRDVCALIDTQGHSANRAQVQQGYAWAYTAARGKYLRDREMIALQRDAKKARRGLWAQDDAREPWEWRYTCWRQHRCDE